ncbi:hypothetical protein ACIBG8_37645 [Nonomuraea sp. NPDC050556]|uniref:hypothetical protein n=1 Tax=Nonomuraea sp. NPDC050556 TaxID=3364369 RepID=UPI0037A58033
MGVWRVVGVYAGLGLLWWPAVRLTRRAVGCGDWDCLAYSVGLQAIVTLAVLAAAIPLVKSVRTAVVAAAVLLVIRAAGEALPSWPSRVVEVLAACTAFATAGAIAAYLTSESASGKRRLATGLGLVSLLPVALALVWFRYGL